MTKAYYQSLVGESLLGKLIAVAGVVLVLFLSAYLIVSPDPGIVDDAANMVLSVDSNQTRFAWKFSYGQARQEALEFLKADDLAKAMQVGDQIFSLVIGRRNARDI
jgi:hypothetical protein